MGERYIMKEIRIAKMLRVSSYRTYATDTSNPKPVTYINMKSMITTVKGKNSDIPSPVTNEINANANKPKQKFTALETAPAKAKTWGGT